MNNVFLVRHADYENSHASNPPLSDRGREQALDLAKRIHRRIGEEIPLIWSSTASRALMTANIINNHFGYHLLDEFEELWSDNEHQFDFLWLKSKLIELRSEDLHTPLIIVTHLEYVNNFPAFVGFPENIKCDYAQGVWFNDGGLVKI